MTKREMNLAVFEGKSLPQVFFQPRIEPWYELHAKQGTLPPDLQGLSLLEAYDYLDISMRYFHPAMGAKNFLRREWDAAVKIRTVPREGGFAQVMDTPHGPVTTELGETKDSGHRIVSFPIKSRDDLPRAEWLFRHMRYVFDTEQFTEAARLLGERGAPQFFVPRSPYQALCLEWMKYEDFVTALMEAPKDFDGVFKAIDAASDALFAQLAEGGHVRIINFGENIDAHLLSPRFFETYHLPYYEKRAPFLQRAGIFTTAHFDGSVRPLLPYLKHLPFDGIEALTPYPQGDVSLEEIKESLGDKILLDGIPAVFFLREFEREAAQACTEQVVKLFSPRLVLGISDEIPMGADAEGIERLKWIVDYCRRDVS